jgi:hypothetical protein
MKKILLAFGFSMAVAGAALAQAGAIGIFKDPAGTNCYLDDKSAGVTAYYVVHVATGGATGCQYSAPKPSCMTATFLSDTNAFPVTVGGSQGGISAGYGACRTGPILIQTISYFTQGLTPACCRYYVLPHPSGTTGKIEVADCSFTTIEGSSIRAVINATSVCPCGEPSAEESTWGQVKTLYIEE